MGVVNDDMPRKESFEFFEKAMSKHSCVMTISKIDRQIYEIRRTRGDCIYVYVTNLYTIGLAEYYDIVEKFPHINAIVTMSNWNGYTGQAKEEAKNNNVGIYVIVEFMGALSWDKYTEYYKKDSRGNRYNFGCRGFAN